MKKIHLLSLFLIIKSLSAISQTAFQRSFGGNNEDYGFALVRTNDGGYAMAGHSNSFTTGGDFDVLLIKLDANENLQWSHTYGGTGSDQSLQLVQTTDSGFAIAGKTTSYGSGDFDALVIKTDHDGNLQWMKTYGGAAEERLLNIRETSDHGFILSGSTLSYGQGNWDMLFIKTNSTGDTAWTKIIGGTDSDQGTDAIQTADGGYVFTGRVRSWGSGNADIFIMKTNASGDSLWARVFGGSAYEEGMKVKQTTDGGYIVTGASTSFTNTSYDVYLNKIDSTGTLIWSRLYAGPYNDATYDVLQLSDGGYILTGETESFGSNHLRPLTGKTSADAQSIGNGINNILGTDHSNVLAVRTDVNGDTLWCKAYGGDKMDEAYAIVQTPDSGFMIIAFTTGFSNDTTDFYLVKTDKNGISSCYESPAPLDVIIPPTVIMNISPQIISGLAVSNVVNSSPSQVITQHDICFETTGIFEMNQSTDPIILYPNPAKDRLYVNRYSISDDDVMVSVYSILGVNSGSFQISSDNQLDISKLSNGVYICKIITSKNVLVKKFIKD